ncbi:hypothetical protein Z951_15480 [Streptomyces sp. PRh5]|nr:hypothetical protein Z951_15480 [Streptomyces sp. PRh5]
MARRAPRIVVQPPSPTGGRTVRVNGTIVGVAYGEADLREFLRRAGLEGAEDLDLARSPLIEWRGGGPDEWAWRRPASRRPTGRREGTRQQLIAPMVIRTNGSL